MSVSYPEKITRQEAAKRLLREMRRAIDEQQGPVYLGELVKEAAGLGAPTYRELTVLAGEGRT